VQLHPASLATLPLRFAIQAVSTAARVGLSVAGRAARLVAPTHPEPDPFAGDAAESDRPVSAPPPVSHTESVETTPEPEPAESAPPAPDHVSEEPVLVAKSADPGAADGAGAEIEVAEPWSGYAGSRAADVVARLAHATAEEVAVAQLYETLHSGRRSVLDAAERRLKVLNSPARP
jgi:hypothetical protein